MLFFVTRCFCKRCVFIHLLYLSSTCLFWVCWVRENFSGGPGHIFSVWDPAVWSAGLVKFNLGTLGVVGGTVQIFFSLAML